MKRSDVNDNIGLAKDLFAAHRLVLPRWAHWSPDDWRGAGPGMRAVKDAGLGWEITDHGSGDFQRQGLVLFRLRDAQRSPTDSDEGFAESVLLVQVHQVTPFHHHTHGQDLVNRGGGDLVVQLHHAGPSDELDDDRPVTAVVDGVEVEFEPGGLARLTVGESLGVAPRVYHKFWAEMASCMVSEISSPANGRQDFHYLEDARRLPDIEEDEEPLHLLWHEYPDLA